MIRIRCGEKTIYDPRNPYLKLIDPRLVLEDNAAGHLSFKVYDTNLNHGEIRKLYPLLEVMRDGRIIFKGRVVSDKKDFYNGKAIEAEGKLAFFNDSCLEPFDFSGSPGELFAMIVENHNSQVMEWQRFKLGMVTVTDPNDYIVRSSEGILNSWEALKSRCFQSSLGGHIRVRYEPDGDYVDWLADHEAISRQGIAFAKNMIDISTEMDATETYTAIRPVGAEVNGEKVSISSVNGGRNHIVNEEKAAEYGVIFAPESESTWEDVTLPQNLLRKAQERLYGQFATLRETYEIRAVDLSLTDSDIEALDVCEYVPVSSRPHGLYGDYLLYKADIAIAKPQDSVFYLGASRRVLSGMGAGNGRQEAVRIPQNVSAFKNDAGYISGQETEEMLEGYAKTEDVEALVGEAVAQIQPGKDGKDGVDGLTPHIGTNGDWHIGTVDTGVRAKGTDGRPGSDGTTPHIGANGDWFLGDTDTGVKAKGLDGISPAASVEKVGNTATVTIRDTSGETQAQLYDGANGITPTIGPNGNWYIGATDTGKPSRGDKGDEGEKGDPGEPGKSVSTAEIQEMIDGSFMENMSGAKVAQDEKGKWGYIPPGADAVIPFNSGGAGIEVIEGDTYTNPVPIDLASGIAVFAENSLIIAEGYEKVDG